MRNKHSMGRRFLALLLCALMMVGLMPTTALAATTTASNATELQNVIKNAKSGDTIQLRGNITFNNSSQITTVADFYQKSQILTYSLKLHGFSERCPSVGGIPFGKWEVTSDGPVEDFPLPLEFRPEDGRSSLYVEGGLIKDSYGNETRVRENGDATTYMLIKDKNLTIDLNGYTINASHNDAYFSALLVTGSSSVTIMDSRNGGGITSSGTAVTASGSGAKVTVNGGNFKGDTTAVTVRDNAEVHLNGGTFTGANVTEREVKKEVKLTEESTYERTSATSFGYEMVHYIRKYTGTAIWTVQCGTLYSDGGSIYIGENKSTSPTFRVPGNGNLFANGSLLRSAQISGGTFDIAPPGYIASGYTVLGKDDGTYEVVSTNDSRLVASVYGKGVGTSELQMGTIYCTSLGKAIELAQDGNTVTLMKNVSGEQILNNNSTYTLNLGGNTISGNVTVKTGNVTIRNGTINYTGTGNALKTEGNSAVLTADCTVTAPNGTALSAGYGSTGGTVNVIGGTYTGKLGTSAGGTLTITGGRYKPDDPSAYLAEGFYAILDSERYYAVTDSPFIEIWNKDDLLAFAKKVNDGDTGANAVLMADIELSGVTWTPIGANKAYTGTFDGKGYSIKNLNSTSGGLFYYIGKGGVVSNVTIASGNISGDWIGAIANQCSGGTIRGCFNHAAVTGGGQIGGIVGRFGAGTIDQCGNSGQIKGTQWVGGIVGFNNSPSGTITNCYNTGKIEATEAVYFSRGEYYTGSGGICGSAHYSGMIMYSVANNCFNYGTISANKNYFVPVSVVGSNNWHLNATANGSAIPGYTSSGTIEAVFARGDITWYLNNSSAEGVWYQTLGVDPYPVLDPTHARVYMGSNGVLTNYTYNGYSTNPVTVNGGNTVAGITSKLPKTVTVNSDKPGGGLTAEVTWDTSPLSNYDPDNWEKQTFTLNGTAYVTGLKNGGEKPVQITVTVNAVTVSSLWVEEEPTKQAYIDGDTLDLSGIKIMAEYNDVNRTNVELSYDSPGVTFSIGNLNNLVTHGMVLDKNKHEGSLTVRYSSWLAGAGYVKFLSTDNTIRKISYLGNVADLGDDGEYTITLPKGTTLPGPEGSEIPGKDYIIVDANDPYKVQSKTLELVEGRNNYWEITVVAESGHAATYYLEVLIEGWNKDAIDSLKQAWDDMDKTWKPTQAEVQQGSSEAGDDNNLSYEMQLKAWLIQTMVERSMEIPANVTTDISFTKGPDWATAGDRHNNRNGVDGKFEFSITFTATQGSEDTHETVTFDSQSGIITATPYAAPDYTVHFNSGAGSPVDDLIVKEDDVIGDKAPADPTFEHYTFLGWFTEQTGGKKWDMENDKVTTNNMTLYAHWELTKYKVVLPESQHGYELKADKEEVVWNESVTFTYKLGVGYNGDALVIKVNGTQVTPDGNGQFTVGGNVDSDIVVTVEGVINAPTYTVTIPESVDLDSTATVSATGVNVAKGSSLYVAIGGEFTIANSNPLFKQTIGYPVHLDSKNGTQIKPDDTVLTVAGGIANNTGRQVLYFGLPTEEPKYADDYKGTVTFRIGIKDTE